MKKLSSIIIFLFLIFGISKSYAQDDFSKFDKDKQFNTVVVTQKMFEMMANVKVAPTNEEEKAYFNLVKKLTSLKVYNTTDKTSKNNLKESVNSYSGKKGLKELANKNDTDSQVKILINKEGTEQNINELIMFNEGLSSTKESIVLIINGSFSLKEIAALTKKMNLPLGDSLNKLSK
ncbi:MAG: DUF4252 domain-containing protein [Flavobacteriaceae bacterium]|jgi:type II secretory ATPase GspE/PulE/Tfp pilus assembly ATPase PilB-like protein|nr:DUF4252 domain-containing protein [Flavobacteriaceae bacterium]